MVATSPIAVSSDHIGRNPAFSLLERSDKSLARSLKSPLPQDLYSTRRGEALALRQRILVAIERAVGMATERGGRAVRADRVVEGALERRCLHLARDHTEEPLAREQAGHGQRDRALRHRLGRREIALVDLLLEAHGIERDLLDPAAVVEVRAGAGLVEGQVSVDADPEADRVDRRLHQEPPIALDRGGDAELRRDHMETADRHAL